MAFRDKLKNTPEPGAKKLVRRVGIIAQVDAVSEINRGIKRIRRGKGLGEADPKKLRNKRGLQDELANVAAEALKEEIDNDPKALGYAGKSDEQIADLLNNPWVESISVPEAPGGKVDLQRPPRINQIWRGVPYCPNTVDAADVAELKTGPKPRGNRAIVEGPAR